MKYKTRYGIDWPEDMHDVLIDLTVGKKWRLIEQETGVRIEEPWVPMLNAAKALVPNDAFRVSEWTEQHFHDFVMYDKLIVWGCASSSKALLIDEPLYFKDHIGTMREAAVGKEVITATGHAAKIVAIHDQIDEPLYKVSFIDGTSTICTGDHLWHIRRWGRLYREKRDGKGRSVMGWKYDTLSAKYMAGISSKSIRKRNYSVPYTKPIAFDHKDVPVDPYILGCILGDGCTRNGSAGLTSHIDDEDVRNEITRRLNDKNPELELRKTTAKYGYIIARRDRNRNKNYIIKGLTELGLMGEPAWEKFIPECYKVNSIDVRLDVIAGLMDTDGMVDKNGYLGFATTSRRLAYDMAYLLRSIGAYVSIRQDSAGYKDKNGVYKRCRDVYELYISGLSLEEKRRLFYLRRKRDRLRDASHITNEFKSIVSVELIKARDKYPRETRCITLAAKDELGNDVNGLFPSGDFNVSHNSNDTGLLLVLDWITDPLDTVSLLGSTGLGDLKSRSWESVERYFHFIKNNDKGLLIPGKISKQGYRLMNEQDDDVAGSSGEKAGIQGRAINEGGRLQGAHAKYVRLVVDELAEINNHDAIKIAMANLRIGTQSFKFIGLANPESWDNPSCQYCEPVQGRDKVDVDTGSWMSTFGCFVRHHDGLKSPCVKDPSLRSKYPFLMSKEEYEDALKLAGGNADAPQVWKMVRGFPAPAGAAIPTVLDLRVADEMKIGEPLQNRNQFRVVGVAGGIDPAWSEGGDGAYRAKVVVYNVYDKPILDFEDGLTRLTISASDPRPVTKQLRDQVIDAMRRPGYEPRLRDTAIDSSGNQGLADDLDIVLAESSLHVNSSQRASEYPLRALDSRKAKEVVYDRGTEAWAVLAEFCRAGMVRGLPREAIEQITRRRYACRAGTTSQMFPLRMEGKDKLRLRIKKSPDECDACALAALAVKERLGIMPFSYVRDMNQDMNVDAFFGMKQEAQELAPMPDPGEYEDTFDYGAYEPI